MNSTGANLDYAGFQPPQTFGESRDYTRPCIGNVTGNCCQSVAVVGRPHAHADAGDGSNRVQARQHDPGPRPHQSKAACKPAPCRIGPPARCAQDSIRDENNDGATTAAGGPLHRRRVACIKLECFFTNLRPPVCSRPGPRTVSSRASRMAKREGRHERACTADGS